MKKTALLMVALLCAAVLCSCGSQKKVPDTYVENSVMEYLDMKIDGYSAYKYSAEHNPNKADHTDEVTVTLEMKWPYGSTIATYTNTYQYWKADDVWELVYEGDAEEESVLDTKALAGSWSGEGIKDLDYFEIDVESISTTNHTIVCSVYFYTGANSWYRTPEIEYSESGTFSLETVGENQGFVVYGDSLIYEVHITPWSGITHVYGNFG